MPSGTQLLLSQPFSRRSGTLGKQREHRIQPVASTSTTRRRKSCSPDTRSAENTAAATTAVASRRRHKRPAHATLIPHPRPPSPDETAVDRGRKLKALPQPPTEESDAVVYREITRGGGSMNGKNKRKERSRSCDVLQRNSRKTVSPAPSDDNLQQTIYTGALAAADFSRMRQDIEILKKEKSATKKTIKQQKQEIEKLKLELELAHTSQKEQSKEVDKLKAQSEKAEGMIANIEANLTCQICMDMFTKPYGLSPCGHVLCQGCLQDWFRQAPPAEDEMFDDEMPQILLYRKKTCPACRAVVRSRPIQLFVVKSIVATLEKGKAPRLPPSPTPDASEDPWAGIFMDPSLHDDMWSDGGEDGEDYDDDDDDEDDDDEDDNAELSDNDDDRWSAGYGTDADEAPFAGEYVRPHWAPPSVHVDMDEYSYLDMNDEDLSMLRRGATLQMIELFAMTYDHDDGLKAVVDGGNVIYLGWNIVLHPDDTTGEEYMDWVTADIYSRPERWEVEDDDLGFWSAWKLMPDTDDMEYESSDSEAWAEDN